MMFFLMVMGGSALFWLFFMLFLHGIGKDTPAPQRSVDNPAPAKPKSAPMAKTANATAPKPAKAAESDDPLDRVRARASEIDFGRIGTASAADKDDLKQIKGIGPFIEEKLNALGIYKFEQIGNFTATDQDKVNEAIEFFSGRIKRDEWVKQAKNLK